MKYAELTGFIFLLFSTGCTVSHSLQQSKTDLINTEKTFAARARSAGIATAFFEFAADNAVISRDSLIRGPEAIKRFYETRSWINPRLEWAPEFADVSASGDLGYTYGHFSFSAMDSSGKNVTRTGIFHTVWKRQPNGTWKFVWD